MLTYQIIMKPEHYHLALVLIKGQETLKTVKDLTPEWLEELLKYLEKQAAPHYQL